MVPTRAVRYHLHLDYITVPCKMHPFFKKGLIFMPAYYDEKTKSWYCKFYYMDHTRTEKQKKKRGFKLQREAKEWGRNFLETKQADLSITFANSTE